MTLIRAAAPKGFSSTANVRFGAISSRRLPRLLSRTEKRPRVTARSASFDGDPFIDAQDWNIDKFDIDVADAGPGKAKATVKFVNLDQPATIVLDLVKVKNDWRVSDITSLRDGKPQSLRGLLSTERKRPGAKTRPTRLKDRSG